MHSVDIEPAVQMIDFVLEDTGVPSGSFDDPRCALMIETGDAHSLARGTRAVNPGKLKQPSKYVAAGFPSHTIVGFTMT